MTDVIAEEKVPNHLGLAAEPLAYIESLVRGSYLFKTCEYAKIRLWTYVAGRDSGEGPDGSLKPLLPNREEQRTFQQILEQEAVPDLKPGEELALGGRVQYRMPDGRNENRYLGMLDLLMPQQEVEAPQFKACRKFLSSDGADLLCFWSDQSLHAYGRGLLSLDKLLRLYGQALLASPGLDEKWLAMSLIRGEPALRVSARVKRVLPYGVNGDWSNAPAPVVAQAEYRARLESGDLPSLIF